MERNKITSIGCLGQIKCYLNVPKVGAIRRYCETYGFESEEMLLRDGLMIREFEFEDTFGAYDIYEDTE
jgi:hypothetical protein